MASETAAVMVVGGGIAGVQCALDLAESGFKVYLVERKPAIGGVMAQLDKTFPTNDCSMCILSPKLVEVGRNPMITLMTLSEVVGVEGAAPNFTVSVKKYPRYVREDRCVSCGKCAEKCPSKVSNEFDRGLSQRKAIYVSYPQAVPLKYSIDANNCLFLTKGRCGNCKKVCPADAIDYEMKEVVEKVHVGSIVLAPGVETFNAKLKREYGYGEYKNVLTALEFERMLSASGPYEGHVVRLSDNATPKNIAFLQCVGSRDKTVGNPYCSSVCCMYALKEAIIAQEHTPGLKTTIFFMDIRAVGKEFEDYRARAEKEHGITIHRNVRVASIQENPESKNLNVLYMSPQDVVNEEFDMVVLSTGLVASPEARELAKTLGVELTSYGFAKTSIYSPLSSNVPGIYVVGAFSAPKDIPQSVAEASGAAAKAGSHVYKNRIKVKAEEVPEIDITGQEPKIGAFICDCGNNIASIVDVPAVVEYARTLPNVVLAEESKYTCSADFQAVIKQKIKENHLNRLIIASCTPRTHEPLFQSTIKEAGLNPFMLEMANIRDQCSWVHMHEPEKATEKAKDLVRMAVAKSRLVEPLKAASFPVNHSALVIGGGLAGMTVALDLAAQDFHVDLVEKEAELGGNVRKVYIEDEVTGASVASDLASKIGSNPNINVHLGTKVKNITGFVGNFTVEMEKQTFKVGAIVVASGAVEYKPKEYFYGQDPRVMTQLELAHRLDKGPLDAKVVAMIQCVGSRSPDNPMCSRVCCTAAMKNAIKIMKHNPQALVYVFYKDIRTYGLKEDLYTEAARLGVVFIRTREEEMPELIKEGDKLLVSSDDITLDGHVHLKPDLVVLSTGIRPNPDNEELSKMLKVPLSKDGFFLEAHMKLRPVDFATEGIFLAGLAHWPKTADETMGQASGAAARAMTILSRDFLEGNAAISFVDESKCRGCGRCEAICPFTAITVTEVSPGNAKAKVNPALCKGCGACEVACCNGAITCKHFTNDQITALVEACLEGVSK
ncbi:MAG: CoB--CoM heterodisulfide reductase iron-sulfur subunit A family protein [Methanomassiliicoccales archaeon]|nr:CoB--CoM heterodisulfide reductase iron-sulfur subunit A family protein [Methanomassiliicoccales archaeon]MDD1757005.1 CoB--CoM heterodisulfide reductase iron-sulfur subunit A family protein [Methanomassiliicoccales archaeon]